jgi:GPH family glycoside/pentoside/hexuronide:cation symporter
MVLCYPKDIMNSGHLSRWQKLGYGVADLGAALSFVTINFFLFIFLVQVAGLNPALAGTAILIGRVLDAVTDPLMGLISDRTRSRWGRRKPYIWAGLVPVGLSFMLLWFVPEGSQTVKFLWATLTLCLFSVSFTVVQVPYMALTPELAPDYETRTSLTSYRIGFGTLASLLAAATPPLIVGAFALPGEVALGSRNGWLAVGIAFGLVIITSYLIMALITRETPKDLPVEAPTSLLDTYLSAFRIYGYPHILALFVLVTLGLGVIQVNLPIYLVSNLQFGEGQQSTIQGLLFIVAILSLPLWNLLSSRRGKRHAFAHGLVVLGISIPLLVWFSPPGMLSAYLIVMTVLAGIGTGAILLFPWAMLPDVVEFDEVQNGVRREGVIYAIFTFGQKLAIAASAFITGLVLEGLGYQGGVLEQSLRAKQGVVFMIGPLAALLFMLALWLVWLYPITRARHEAAQQQLLRRTST